MSIKLSEGILKADRIKKTLSANTEDQAIEKLDLFMKKNKNYNPKVSSKKPKRDSNSQFYFDVSYDALSATDDKSLLGRAKRGVGAVKQLIKDIPSQKKLTASTRRKLSIVMKDFQTQYPSAKFGKIRDLDGNFVVLATYYKEEPKEPEKEPETETETEKAPEQSKSIKNRISNIQKQLSNLSPKEIGKIEQFVIKSMYK